MSFPTFGKVTEGWDWGAVAATERRRDGFMDGLMDGLMR